MLIIWGHKQTTRKAGHVADFCPVCHEARPFTLRRLGRAGHIYYVSFGSGRLIGHDRVCQLCGTSFPSNPATYACVAKNPMPLPELAALTFPNLGEVHRAVLEQEEAIRRDPQALPPARRHALIRDAMLRLSPQVQQRLSAIHVDKEIGLSLLATVLVVLLAPPVFRSMMPPEAVETALKITIGCVLAWVVWQIATSGERYLRRHITPALAIALAPLHPTAEELTAVLAELRQQKHKMGGRLKVHDLLKSIHLRRSAGV